jgi:outer membrane biosynthesis protein TonB
MKHLKVNLRIAFATLSAIVLVGGVGVFRASADSWDKKTTLTINEPVQVRDRLLEPGTYVFKLLNSPSDRHIVQIFNEDQSHIIDTVLAIPNYRLEPTGNSRFGFWETPPGYAKALRAWFYPGDNFGQEFPYPKHLAVVETASATTTITREPALVEPAPAPAPAPAPEPQPQAAAPQPQATAPQEMATNAAPPPTPEAAPEPAPAPVPAPAPAPEPQAPAPAQSLPKTASTYPLVGTAGLLSLALFGVIRMKRANQRS